MGNKSSKAQEPVESPTTDKIEKEIQVIQKNHELESEIKEAVKARDFEKAASVQAEINALRSGMKPERLSIMSANRFNFPEHYLRPS